MLPAAIGVMVEAYATVPTRATTVRTAISVSLFLRRFVIIFDLLLLCPTRPLRLCRLMERSGSPARSLFLRLSTNARIEERSANRNQHFFAGAN